MGHNWRHYSMASCNVSRSLSVFSRFYHHHLVFIYIFSFFSIIVTGYYLLQNWLNWIDEINSIFCCCCCSNELINFFFFLILNSSSEKNSEIPITMIMINQTNNNNKKNDLSKKQRYVEMDNFGKIEKKKRNGWKNKQQQKYPIHQFSWCFYLGKFFFIFY